MVNEWTRKDLPSLDRAIAVFRCGDPDKATHYERQGVIVLLDAVVDHLNEHGGTPAGDAHGRVLDLAAEVNDLKAERDEAVMRAEMAEQERDQARGQWKKWESKANEWKARAEAAERERDEARQIERESEELRKKMKSLLDGVSEALNGPKPEWGSWGHHDLPEKARAAVARAEAADAACEGFKEYIARFCKPNPAPAVTREDVEKAIRAAFDGGGTVGEVREMADVVWSLVSGADPAVFVVRESDVATVQVKRNDNGWFARNVMAGPTWSPDNARARAALSLSSAGEAAEWEAIARAIEAEAEPVDPVTVKARELFDEAGRGNSKIEFDEMRPDHRGEYLRIAAHVLGQEAKR